MPTCEHCGEEFPKGGAFATHVRYCEARPEAEDRSQSEDDQGTPSEDLETGEPGGAGSAEGLAAEIEEGSPETRATPPAEAAESEPKAVEGGETDGTSHTDDHLPGTGPATTGDGSGRRWLVALVVLIAVVILWRLLARRGD